MPITHDLRMRIGMLTNLQVRMQWQIENDPTYLPQIEVQVSAVIQELLNIPEASMPEKITTDGFRRFKTLYKSLGITCRYSICRFRETVFYSESDRVGHETTHTRAYKCPDCDFSTRDFATKSSLHKHQEKYHMQPEDFQIPKQAGGGSTLTTTPPRNLFHRQDFDWSSLCSGYASSHIPLVSPKSLIDPLDSGHSRGNRALYKPFDGHVATDQDLFPFFGEWRDNVLESMTFQTNNGNYVPGGHPGYGSKQLEVLQTTKKLKMKILRHNHNVLT